MKYIKNIDNIFSDDGLISNLKTNYSPRESQIECAKEIYRGLVERKTTLIEGETGLGKSFAYLFPSLDYILNESDGEITKKIIIVTSGIALQEQLINKDIPFVLDVLKQDYRNANGIRATLLKGRQNFICMNKALAEGLNVGSSLNTEIDKLSKFFMNTDSGDLSELDFIPEKDTLATITCSKQGECLGSLKCPFSSDCFYNKHKDNVFRSNIIVTNYHYYFSDIKTSGKLLPKSDITIFDEAHEAATICRDFNQQKISYHNIVAVRNKISEIKNSTNRYNKIIDSDLINSLTSRLEYEFSKLSSLLTNEYDSTPLIENVDEIPPGIFSLKSDISKIVSQLDSAISIQLHSDGIDNDIASEGKILSAISSAISTANEILEVINNLSDSVEDENVAVWVESVKGIYYISLKPVDISSMFSSSVLTENTVCIFTSATLTVSGSFDYIKNELGIGNDTIEYIGHSPFNLTEQQLWYLPANAVEGNSPNFNKLCVSQVEEIIKASGGGALCLFTSTYAMKSAYNLIRYKVGFNIYCQGDKPKMKLIDDFKNDINSCLFATKSFFTGVDIPGKSLRVVVIDKFPFPQPSDPIQKMLMKKPNSFYKYCIPQMIILLKQAVGRGVRGVDDKAVVAILDNRLATARYKNRINASFNYKKTSSRDLETIKDFINNYI